MYGMLLESVQHFVQLEYGEEMWNRVMQLSGCRHSVFNTHQVYPDTLITNLAGSCAQVTSSTLDAFMQFFGRCFVRYFSNFGYDTTVKAAGRFFTDFLQSVDNIHMQMRFTYPKMKSPSMYLTNVDQHGVVLVYRSTRQGFTYYLMGQLYQIALELYGFELDIVVLDFQTITSGAKTVQVKFRLNFDNREYMISKNKKNLYMERLSFPPVSANLLLQLFQFGLLIRRNLSILGVGEKLLEVWGETSKVLGDPISKHFKLRRPKGIPFTWNNIIYLHSVIFELELIRIIKPEKDSEGKEITPSTSAPAPLESMGANEKPDLVALNRRGSQGAKSVLLRGQMRFIEDINAVMFLCSPLINDLEELTNMGLFLADLNQHGLSREMVMQGFQNGSRLEMMFERAEQRSDVLERNHDLLESWKKRGDELLYTMIPKTVAEVLRNGKSPLSTCETFDCVTIQFCELVGFNSDTVQDVMDVVTTMNAVFSCFDELMDKYEVYKVETVGSVYMSVAGAPDRCDDHSERVVDVALQQLSDVKKIKIPSSIKLEIRIGIHSGSVVAGVVGLKVPRYCFFGDTVNTASRMQSTSEPGKIQISTVTCQLLPQDNFILTPRGQVFVKGKGNMDTFWVHGHKKPEN